MSFDFAKKHLEAPLLISFSLDPFEKWKIGRVLFEATTLLSLPLSPFLSLSPIESISGHTASNLTELSNDHFLLRID